MADLDAIDPQEHDDEDEELTELEDEGLVPVAAKTRVRRRREGARPKVTSGRHLVREVLRYQPEARGIEKVVADLRAERPRTRGDCVDGERPCGWVSCKYHNYLSVNPESGAITINFPDKEPWEIPETCALDVADRGGVTLEEVGELTNVTRERVRQVETRALVLLRGDPGTHGLR